jgi:hypothetical protein
MPVTILSRLNPQCILISGILYLKRKAPFRNVFEATRKYRNHSGFVIKNMLAITNKNTAEMKT